MEQKIFEELVKKISKNQHISQTLNELSQNEMLAEAATELVGQFSLAVVDGEKRIYHIFSQPNENGEMEEFVEYVMNEEDEMIVFVAWFFERQFDIKVQDTYQAAGKSYKQPKRRSVF